MVEDKDELCRLVDSLMAELESMKDSHLLVLKVKNDVEAHVWVEQADPDDPVQANYVFVDIAPGNHGAEVSLRIPQGAFLLGSFIGNQFMEVRGKEIMKTIHQSIMAKIKEKERGHGHDQPHHGQAHHEEPRHDQPHHDEAPIEEMHRHVEHLKEKVDHLRRQGRHEEAEGLEREIDEMRRKIKEIERGGGHEQPHHEKPHHDQPHPDEAPIEEMRRHVEHLKEKMDHLRRQGRHEEANGLEREVDEVCRTIEEMERGRGHDQPHHEDQPHHDRSDDAEQRTRVLNAAIDHMFEAAKRLHEADAHELAEQLAREAERFRREINK